MPEKKDIKWDQLGYNYIETDYRYVSYCKEGKWDSGRLITNPYLPIHESSGGLQNAQACLEGMKAFPTKDGGIQFFRPDMNAKRFQESCERVLMPTLSVDRYITACKEVVLANEAYVPPYGCGGTLYLRPFMLGEGPHMGGANPSKDYLFFIYTTPVGSYYKSGMKPVYYTTSTEHDRAAPLGTGRAKITGNYGGALLPHKKAVDEGFVDCVYLDPLTHTMIDEVGTANFFGITKDGKFVAPDSATTLRSITKLSLMYLAEHYLHMPVEVRDVRLDELDEFAEAGVCGTAAAIVPVAGIKHRDKMYEFYDKVKIGPVTQKLYDTYTGIQFGDIEAPEGWICRVK